MNTTMTIETATALAEKLNADAQAVNDTWTYEVRTSDTGETGVMVISDGGYEEGFI